MRIGLVSPYSWSYQGGVNRHVEALAEEFLGRGHDVRVLAPVDPPGRVSRVAAPGRAGTARAARLPGPAGPHRRLRRQRLRLQPRALPPAAVVAPRREVRARRLRRHPRPRAAGAAGRLERDAGRRDPGRRHLPRLLDQAAPQPHRQRARRPPYLQPPLGPDRRLRGRRLDRPALVRRRLHDHPQRGRRRRRAERAAAAPAEELRILFVGRPEERKGLPILLTAFGALVEHVPCRLTVIGAEREDVLRYLADPELLQLDRRPRPGLRRAASGPSCTRPTCSAPPRSPARASAWS